MHTYGVVVAGWFFDTLRYITVHRDDALRYKKRVGPGATVVRIYEEDNINDDNTDVGEPAPGRPRAPWSLVVDDEPAF